ncbi:nuclear receptor subfamily 1 group I member 2 isoform X1 [Epinephelus fuscoguttatus]|uniref:nuclear receptor subfamily 1 group I member 2 isoform X1 n=1 Tax=Epinephelus fuscoguttatus TaxID=293821 RepID=UPI0020D0DB39|nr:nuclear receptor subfamily 1 group I member 2 isoform X1 [Epinephelus fuscoguttatus]XP_049450730.1 nuclear receptor subfamily 1 group I member 2 isoform X1 [Epinephelus fuscoguttatus]XP_049450731.1 nuclear receptor subfamily 1 group I member 2 isoform X1 [Epinephelus fuscoguttatus]
MTKSDTGVQSIREALTRHNEEDDDDEEEKLIEDNEPRACGVCGDLAKGYHFNALTCEGCKGFFRRAIKKSGQLRCRFLNKCSITKNNRRSCPACRLRKCQAIGMRQERFCVLVVVMSEEEVLERRIRIKTRKMLEAPAQLSSQQEETIQELLRGHRNSFDSAFYRFSGFRPMDRNVLSVSEYNQSENSLSSFSSSLSPSSSSTLSGSFEKQENPEVREGSVFTALPHVADLTTYMIQDIISFSRSLRDFRSLSIGDQISLLKGATFEIMQIRFNMVFNAKTGIWECGHITYCIDDAVRAGFQPLLLEPLLRFHHTLRKLGLQEEEYILMQAMSLFSPDRPGVQQHSVIDQLHENLALTLKTWIDCRRTGPEKHLLYPKVMACLTEMRTMTEEYSKQVLQIQDIQPNVIPPLIMEMVSKSPCSDL